MENLTLGLARATLAQAGTIDSAIGADAWLLPTDRPQ